MIGKAGKLAVIVIVLVSLDCVSSISNSAKLQSRWKNRKHNFGSGVVRASVTYDEGTKKFQFHGNNFPVSEKYAAHGEFEDMRYTFGWTFLTVDTDEGYADYIQAYAAGLAEGYLTQAITAQHWNNTIDGYCTPDASSAYCQRLKTYLDTNFNTFIRNSISLYAKTDPYWHQVELFLYQLSGLTDGLNNKTGTPRTDVDLFGYLMFQIDGDLEDLEVALNKPEKERKKILGSGSCSALIKLLPNNTDLYVAQDTWNNYGSMLRVIKRYLFKYHQLDAPNSPLIPGNEMLFSSYPGSLMSGDDFYLLGSNITSIETTIGNSNPDLIKYIQPMGTVLEGIRSQVANRLATDGLSWGKVFAKYNSGTYNNEWMIVDYNKFTPGQQKLNPGLLVVLEQIPNIVAYSDLTDVLAQQTYWASYNSPYYGEIFNASGAQALVDKYGDWFTYDKTPRAQIFKRDHTKVVDMKSMQALMRYNDYQHDELSKCNCTPPYSAENAISARSDLNPKSGTYPFSALGHRSHGGTDMKLVNYRMVHQFMIMAQSGPTHTNQPPFSWKTSDFADTVRHEGHPDVFDFEALTTNW